MTSLSKITAHTLFFGEHPSMRDLHRLIERVARSQARTVLIYGETGTGKGLIARMLHELSPRKSAPFLDINCAAIPSSLLESELFGHEKGAFTGAVSRKQGLIEAADGGTFFLDEVRELDPVMQAKMLTLLDTRRMRRVGGVQPIDVDVRFIAATNKILLGEVESGLFRDDLYYRLQVIALNIPPLRDRGDDLFLLAERFMQQYSREYGSTPKRFSPEVQEIFRGYTWPGNVRELENLIERICLLEDGDRVLPEHLPRRILRTVQDRAAGSAPRTPASTGTHPARAAPDGVSPPLLQGMADPKDYHGATQAFQRRLIEQALAEGAGPGAGRLAHAAQQLGLSRHALRHQMHKLGLSTDDA